MSLHGNDNIYIDSIPLSNRFLSIYPKSDIIEVDTLKAAPCNESNIDYSHSIKINYIKKKNHKNNNIKDLNKNTNKNSQSGRYNSLLKPLDLRDLKLDI